MSWLSSIGIAMVCGILGLLCGGFIMNACVDWYRVSSFEGKSGYAIIFVALLGGFVGLLVGLVAARWVAAMPDPTFLKGLGTATGAVLALALITLVLCRLGAPEPLPEVAPSPAPAPSGPSAYELEAARFAALSPGAPIEDWLVFVRSDGSMERNNAVMLVVGERQSELVPLLTSFDPEVRERAQLAAQFLAEPIAEIGQALLAEGHEIAEEIRRVAAMESADPSAGQALNELRRRFLSWKQAWWVLHPRLGLEGRPPLQQIHDLASEASPNPVILEIVGETKKMLDSLD